MITFVSVLALFTVFLLCRCGDTLGRNVELLQPSPSGDDLMRIPRFALVRNGTSTDVVRLGAFVTGLKQQDMLINISDAMFQTTVANSTKKSRASVELSIHYSDMPNYYDIIHSLCEELLPQNTQGLLLATDESDYAENYVTAKYVATTAAYLGLPVISLNPGLPITTLYEATMTSPTLLQLAASTGQETAAILDFLSHHEWYCFNVVTSLFPGHIEFLSEIEHQVEQRRRLHFEWKINQNVQIDPSGNLYLPMQKLSYSNISVFVLYSTKEEARTIFRYAKNFKFFEQGYVWIVAEIVTGSLENIRRAPQEFPPGLIAMKFHSLAYNFHERVIDALSIYEEAAESFIKQDTRNYEVRTCSQRNLSNSELFQILMNTPIPNRTSFSFSKHGFIDNARLLFTRLNENSVWKKVGMWRNGSLSVDEISWLGKPELPPRGQTKRRHIRIVSIVEMPFVSIVPYEKVNMTCHAGVTCVKQDLTTGAFYTMCCSGYCIELLQILSRDLKFTYDLYLVDDDLYGVRYDNGSWNGIVRDLIDGKADAAVAAVKMSTERFKVVDFSVPFMDVGVAVLVPKSSGVVLPHAFLAPFDIALWVIVLVVTLNVAAVSVFVFEFCSPSGYDGKIEGLKVPYKSKFTLGRAVWMTWGILFNNSVPSKVPRSYTGKFMTNMWACFALIFVAMYTGNLAAHMIHEETHEKISGITDEKIQKPHSVEPPFKFGTVGQTSVERLIETTNQKMFHYMKEFVQPSAEEASQALEKGKIDAFVYDSAVLENMQDKDPKCNLIMVGKVYGTTGFAIAFTKGSPWKARFDRHLLLYDDLGILDKLRYKFIEGVCTNKNARKESSRPLNVENFAGAFYLLIVTVIISVLTFICECHCNRHLPKCCARRTRKMGFLTLISQEEINRRTHKGLQPIVLHKN
ncbi:glutamate receptor ionotropic, NMDA 2B-like [Glandiceps talaboti]